MRENSLVGAGIVCTILAIPQLLLTQVSVALDAAAWATVVLLAGGILVAYAPRAAHLYALGCVLAWLVLGAGFAEVATVILWLAGAWSLGVLSLRWLHNNKPHSDISTTEATVLGATIFLAVWGGMIHFTINYRWLYFVLCLLPCLLISHSATIIYSDWCDRATKAQDWMRSIPFWAWLAGLILIGWVLRWTSFPTMGYDDHAQHLRIWTELLSHRRYGFDINTQIWSVAPFAVDILHAGLSLMAGSDVRGAMNLALAILILLLMVRILHTWKRPVSVQWLLVVLMASTPMLGNLLLSLQTELTLAVVALAGMRLVIDANESWRGKNIMGVLACAALCAAIKLPGAVLGLMLLAALAIHSWRDHTVPKQQEYRLRWHAVFLLVPLCFVAFHSYILAWKVTGNPIFPLYNAIFLSPFFAPENFSDPRWIHGFSLLSYARAFFYTSEFFESGNFTAGWQYLFLLPAAVFAVFQPGVPNSLRITLLPVLGFGFAMFSATQYWRYLFPVMPLASLLLASLFFRKEKRYNQAILMLLLACIGLNMTFFDRVSWMMHSPASSAFTQDGKNDLVRLYAPAALLTERISQLAPGSRVLYPPSTPYGATLRGHPLYVNWYAPSRETKFTSLTNAGATREFLAQENVDFVILSMSDQKTAREPEGLLREYLAQFGSVVAQEGPFLLYRVSETPILYNKIFDLRAQMDKMHRETEPLLRLSESGIFAQTEPKQLAVLQTTRAKQARYTVNFDCQSELGLFVAQINWNKGPPYYRLVSCESRQSSFTEAIHIPVGATEGILYVTARDTAPILVESLIIEVH